MPSFNSLKFKISVLAMLFLAATLIAYTCLLHFTSRHLFYQELDNTLVVRAQRVNNAVTSYLDVLGNDMNSFEFSVQRVITRTGDHPHKNKIEKLERLWVGEMTPLGLGSDYIEFADARGHILARSNNLGSDLPGFSQKDIQRTLENHPVFKDLTVGKERLRLTMIPVVYQKIPRENKYVIVIATSRERLYRILKRGLVTDAVCIVIILLIASFLSHFFSRSVLRPISDIAETARNVNYSDLSIRIKSEHVDQEIKVLLDSFNEMMSRLEKAFQYISDFSSHASHELKTPLAILRGESELVLRSKHSEEEYRNVIQNNLEEISRMSKIVDDLLLLTRLDYQPQVFKFENFDLAEFFREIEQASFILAEDKMITVESLVPEKKIMVYGDRMHLRRLFFNLVNNAIKFTPQGGRIGMQVQARDRWVEISVSDTGIGIPQENIPKIFDKFFHHNILGENAPSGNGLGLSIAQSIVKIHHGEISVKSAMGHGSTFLVRLPVSFQKINNI